MKTLRGTTALVTGASRGIGPHIAGALAQQGTNLVLSARKVSSLAPKLAERMSTMIGVPAMFEMWAAAAMQAGQR